MKEKIVILGAGYGGILAANRLAKQVNDIEILLINESDFFYERVRNHETAVSGKDHKISITKLIRPKITFLQDKVKQISPNKNEVILNKQTLVYDYLVYALGSTAVSKSENETSVTQYGEAKKIFENFNQDTCGNITILGAGLTGIELAFEWKEKYPKTKITILDRGEFAGIFSDNVKKYIREKCEKNSITIKDKTKYLNFLNGFVHTEGSDPFQSDLVINCLGMLSSDIGKISNLPTNDKNQVIVNSYLQVNQYSNIFCIGDSASVKNSYLRSGCVTALPMGAYVADSIANRIKSKSVSKFDFKFIGRCVSLGRSDGIIQFTNPNDSPKNLFLKGKFAALFKELVVKFTVVSLYLEKVLPFRFYFWPKADIETINSKQNVQHRESVSV
ncbi:FAD-dependent oxidoreductase [Leptospira sp. 96542]|nr:FAD-dependent oxidoreductase [Leptospira sp. 96542]